MPVTKIQPLGVNSNATFTFANATVTGNLLSGNANLGNAVVANFFVGNGSLLTGLPASYSNAEVANYLPNYTGNVSANFFIGNGSLLTGLPVSYSNAEVANYLPTYTGNITANTANLSGNLNVTGRSNLGSVGNVRITGGSADQYLRTDGTGNLTWATVTGGGGGGGGVFTAATAPPAGGNNRGDMWYNTSTDVLYEYISDGTGNYWVDVQSPTIVSSDPTAYVSRTYTANGSGTTYTVSQGANIHNVLVYLNGIAQLPTTDYTISGTTLTFDAAPANGTLIFIRELMPPPVTDITQTIGTINVITTANTNTLNVTANTTTGNLQVSGNIIANGVSNLGAIGNVKITGGSNGQFISTDGTGNLSFTSVTATRAAAVIMGIVFGG